MLLNLLQDVIYTYIGLLGTEFQLHVLNQHNKTNQMTDRNVLVINKVRAENYESLNKIRKWRITNVLLAKWTTTIKLFLGYFQFFEINKVINEPHQFLVWWPIPKYDTINVAQSYKYFGSPQRRWLGAIEPLMTTDPSSCMAQLELRCFFYRKEEIQNIVDVLEKRKTTALFFLDSSFEIWQSDQ